MTVIDASTVVSAVLGDGPHAAWAVDMLQDANDSPHGMPVEVANALRKMTARGQLDESGGALALADAVALSMDLWPFEPFADRVWELRDSVAPYDGWYVALAEALDEPLVTLDRKLATAHGPRCEFLTPPT
jgi:predicted nucleic acid-binding protein